MRIKKAGGKVFGAVLTAAERKAMDMEINRQIVEADRRYADDIDAMEMYFALCAQDDMKPSVAGMALAFGVDRKTIWAWANGVDSKTLPAESRNLIKKAYQLLNAQMESYMQNGKINPVAGIFLMKNNMGYADKQEVVLTPNQQLGDQVPAEDLEKKYLEDVVGASSDYDPED